MGGVTQDSEGLSRRRMLREAGIAGLALTAGALLSGQGRALAQTSPTVRREAPYPQHNSDVATLKSVRDEIAKPENIPNLDAAKITSGAFDAARIPNLDAAKITDGTLAAARIPKLAGDKVEILRRAVTADYTLVEGDAGRIIEVDSSSPRTITVPGNVFAAGTIINVMRRGSGTVTLGVSGITARRPAPPATPNWSIKDRWGEVSIFFRTTTEVYVVGGLA
jgi:hypothetical protein